MQSEGDDRPVLELPPPNPTAEQVNAFLKAAYPLSFHRHSVCIYVEFWIDKTKRDRSKVAIRAFSGVLLDISGQWLALTAGHCIQVVDPPCQSEVRHLPGAN